ncbi:MAG: phosphatidylglycerol lysyltransferase domain-containing protein [Desulfovibrio sp.]|jgi:hypothetical protein|nr:phosphatidylglycerol lysyltransferase domain-containing protein [Desulfovibrio sp.]
MQGRFDPVGLEERDAFYELWARTPVRSLDYTLPNLWGWQEGYGLEWSFAGDLCLVRQTVPTVCYWAPVGDWEGADWASVLSGMPHAASTPFMRIPEGLLRIWQGQLGDRVSACEDRGQWEYLYGQKDLATLPGNRFHKKRNHLNAYVKAYGDPDYRILDETMVEDVLAVQDLWCQWHECENSPSLIAENEAMNRVLAHLDCFRDLVGGSLYIEGRMVAFSIGERLDPANIGVHYEKGLSGYKGVYQTMNALFARNAGAGYAYVNRAQDLDEEGLRQAKMTYLPADFLRKYRVSVAFGD